MHYRVMNPLCFDYNFVEVGSQWPIVNMSTLVLILTDRKVVTSRCPGNDAIFLTTQGELWDPANTKRNKHVIVSSKRRFHVIIACLLRYVFAGK